MKHKDYMKLMKTPFDELSVEDQKKRTTEFNKRLKLCTKFLVGLRNGHVDDDMINLLDDDDPMKERLEVIQIQTNDVLNAKA
jgi:hypothetical protein|tara:strand:- start:220 stop:465 length:246 start_codon:yes stop_codon:yes gene_type:complete